MGIPGDPASGVAELAELRNEFAALKTRREDAHYEIAVTGERNALVIADLCELQKEVHFLRLRHEQEEIARALRAARNRYHGTTEPSDEDSEEPENSISDNASDEQLSIEEAEPSPPLPPKHRKQFRRYFKEKFEYERTELHQMDAVIKLNNKLLSEAKADINTLRSEKNEFMDIFHVNDIEDIPGFMIPKPDRGPRVNFWG